MFVSKEKLDFWIAHHYNVLFVGKHGVGKTTVVLDAFQRAGLKYLYYSAATMDPWVDMIGVPKEHSDENGETYLSLVRPREFQNDEVEALFFDEFNRSHKKVRNAVMELIQFKSINGRRFNNLKVVWAAINPSDDEDTYDVEKLDPAQEDRFHIKISVPYRPDAAYFKSKYGPQAARAAIKWWGALPSAMKDEISPRRLDYALDIFKNGGDLRDALPHKSNVSKLITDLEHGPAEDHLDAFMKKKDRQGAKTWLEVENNFAAVRNILPKGKYMEFFVPLLDAERLSLLVSKDHKIRDFVIEHRDAHEIFHTVLSSILETGGQKTLTRYILRNAPELGRNPNAGIPNLGKRPIKPLRRGAKHDATFRVYLDGILNRLKTGGRSSRLYNTVQRRGAVRQIAHRVPQGLPFNDAIVLIAVLSNFAKTSHQSTLVGWGKEFFGPLNAALETAYQSGMTWKRLIKTKDAELRYLVMKAQKSSAVAERILVK